MTSEHDQSFDSLPPEERLFRMRHSAAHVLAEAVLEMFPEAKYAIGPPIEHGFYYDFDLPRSLVPEDLGELEARMRESVARDLAIRGEQLPKDEARKVFANQPYKLELIDDITDATVGYFRHGEFQDLCRGGHTERTGQIGAFKLTHVAGAYWRGDEHRPMLQRIYGALYPTQEELDAYLLSVEEAEKRDHRRLGRELDLFHLDPLAPGSPFYHPKGALLYNGLIEYMRGLYVEYGYTEVITPQLFNVDIFKTSGHYENFGDDMFMFEADEVEIGVKPMNCPGHCVLYASGHHSYRELPLRLAEFTRLHRNERSGTLHGLTRVRSFSQDDSHIYCTPEQMESEIQRVFQMTRRIYDELGLGTPIIRLATRPEKFVGEIADWDRAEQLLGDAIHAAGYEYTLAPGEGAFYAPKVEFHFRDAIGRSWQLGTVQVDQAMQRRFGLKYIGEDGAEHTPVMLHRAILGSLERFLGVYIEHTEGRFPLWLAPVQAVVIPIADRHLAYAEEVARTLRSHRLRAEVDAGPDRMGAKIRQAQLQKVPYMLVVGDREAEQHAAALRARSGGDLGARAVDEIASNLATERDTRALEGSWDQTEEFDSILRSALSEFGHWLNQAPFWRARENECVNVFAHRFLAKYIRPGGPVSDLAQIGIEVAVPQVHPASVVGRRQKADVRKDLVVWPSPGMHPFAREFKRAWSLSENEDDRTPAVVVEWKVRTRNISERDREWLEEFTLRYPRTLGIAVSIDFTSGGASVNAIAVRRGQTQEGWLVV